MQVLPQVIKKTRKQFWTSRMTSWSTIQRLIMSRTSFKKSKSSSSKGKSMLSIMLFSWSISWSEPPNLASVLTFIWTSWTPFLHQLRPLHSKGSWPVMDGFKLLNTWKTSSTSLMSLLLRLLLPWAKRNKLYWKMALLTLLMLRSQSSPPSSVSSRSLTVSSWRLSKTPFSQSSSTCRESEMRINSSSSVTTCRPLLLSTPKFRIPTMLVLLF